MAYHHGKINYKISHKAISYLMLCFNAGRSMGILRSMKNIESNVRNVYVNKKAKVIFSNSAMRP